MGYRSNVYIKINKTEEDKLTDLFDESGILGEKEYEHGDYVGYVISDVKWYSNYKDVKAINDFIDEDSKYLRGLIAIGEDNAMEEHGYPMEVGLHVISEIGWGN